MNLPLTIVKCECLVCEIRLPGVEALKPYSAMWGINPPTKRGHALLNCISLASSCHSRLRPVQAILSELLDIVTTGYKGLSRLDDPLIALTLCRLAVNSTPKLHRGSLSSTYVNMTEENPPKEQKEEKKDAPAESSENTDKTVSSAGPPKERADPKQVQAMLKKLGLTPDKAPGVGIRFRLLHL
jgi:hypothetical protein